MKNKVLLIGVGVETASEVLSNAGYDIITAQHIYSAMSLALKAKNSILAVCARKSELKCRMGYEHTWVRIFREMIPGVKVLIVVDLDDNQNPNEWSADAVVTSGEPQEILKALLLLFSI